MSSAYQPPCSSGCSPSGSQGRTASADPAMAGVRPRPWLKESAVPIEPILDEFEIALACAMDVSSKAAEQPARIEETGLRHEPQRRAAAATAPVERMFAEPCADGIQVVVAGAL